MGMLVNACPRLLTPTSSRRRVHADAFMVCASLYDAAVLYEDMCCLQQWMHKQQTQYQQQQQSHQALVPVCGRKRCREATSIATTVKQARHATSTSVHPVEHPSSLQFALPFLSTQQTSKLAYELGKVGDELSWLNAQHTQRVPVHQVFGWQNALWANNDRDQVVWKAAKAFQGKPTRQLATKVWRAMGLQGNIEVLYTVSDLARVVRQTESSTTSSIWLEVAVPRRDDICIMRKQLQHFEGMDDKEVVSTMARQCTGLLFKPFLMPVKGRVMGGTTLSAVRALTAKQGSASIELENVVETLPSTILDWEDAFINRPTQ